MTMFHFKTYTAVTLIGLLAACGGGGGGGSSSGGGGPRTVFTYQTFDSEVPGDSDATAVGLTQSDPSGLPDGVTTIFGDLNRETRELTIDGVLVGTFDEVNGSWTDGTTTVSPSDLAVFANTSTFDFFVPVTVTEAGGFASTYIVGIATRTEDLPTDPDAGDTSYTFTGVAHVGGILGSDGSTAGTAFESGGDLTLSADFQTGLVGAVIDDLTEGGIPFDTVRIADMVIGTETSATFERTGTGFVTFENDGDAVTPSLGASTTESASGAFFGGATAGNVERPAEAGGAFSVNGENGNTIFGVFAAD